MYIYRHMVGDHGLELTVKCMRRGTRACMCCSVSCSSICFSTSSSSSSSLDSLARCLCTAHANTDWRQRASVLLQSVCVNEFACWRRKPWTTVKV